MRSNWGKFIRLDQRLKSNLKPIKSESQDTILNETFTGKLWEEFFDLGDKKIATEEINKIPKNLQQKLLEDCPFWNEQKARNYKVMQTHYLVWVPVGFDILEKLESELFNQVKKVQHHSEAIELLWAPELTEKKYTGGYWLLMTKDLVPCSREKNRKDCEEDLGDEGYKLPNALDWAVGLYTYFLKNNAKLVEGDAGSVTSEKTGRIEKNSFSYLEETIEGGHDVFGSGFGTDAETGKDLIEIGVTQPQ